MIDLSHVTLCAVDCLQPLLAQRALLQSARECSFGDTVLFSDSDIARDVRRVEIAPIRSKQAYSQFMLKELHRHIHTPWVLVVQWDGYVVNPRAWREAFLEYDYIGAIWPKHRDDGLIVGNGGFSLRSKRLLDVMASSEFPAAEDEPEDVTICRIHRAELEARHGIRFAPSDVATRFAYESAQPDIPTFGFHGVFNLWRHMDDETLTRVVAALHPSVLLTADLLSLLCIYCDLRKFNCVRAIYRRMREFVSHEDVVHHLSLCGRSGDVAALALETARILAGEHAFA